MQTQSRRCASLIRTIYRITISLSLITLSVLYIPSSRAATHWYVSPAGSDTNSCRTPANPCKSIGTTISRSASGDTIELAAGTYGEVLTITKDLTLIGSGADRTAIDANHLGTVLTVQALAQVTLNGISLQNGNGGSSGGIHNYYGAVTLIDSIVRNNYALNGFGGGIYNRGPLIITNSIVEDNSAPIAGGGIYNAEGPVTIYDSIIRHNSAAYTRSALVSTYGGGIANDGPMTVYNSIISENSSYSSTVLSIGGGIANVSLLTIKDTLISDNQTVGIGGAIHNWGTVNLQGATMSGNTASRFIPRADGGLGGGIYNLSLFTISNSTLNGNDADDTGGAIWSSGTISITNVTISDNSATVDGGGVAHTGGTLTIQNTILATNTTSTTPDCSGTLTSQGYNLVGDSSGCTFLAVTGDLVGSAASPIDPQLDELRFNGGATPTQQLLEGSPAIDAANPAQPGSGGTACPTTDQRGFRRPQGQDCDIGAYELGPLYFLPWVQQLTPGAVLSFWP